MNTRTLDGQLLLPLVDSDANAKLERRITPGWQTQAACNGEPGDRFYPDADDDSTDATPAVLAVCNGCRVRSSCRAAALLGSEQGIWGGTTETDRAAMYSALAAGASVDAVLLATLGDHGQDAA